MRTRQRPVVVVALGCSLAVASCGTPNGPYAASIGPGLTPRMSAQDAINITRRYLDDQAPEIIDADTHIPPAIRAVWAVPASDAWRVDGCIPAVSGTGTVWITTGDGDYLNLHDQAWSTALGPADRPDTSRWRCAAPGPQGTIVIDDATGDILGVYPESPGLPHPSPPAG
jgi:hypothetical protein